MVFLKRISTKRSIRGEAVAPHVRVPLSLEAWSTVKISIHTYDGMLFIEQRITAVIASQLDGQVSSIGSDVM